MEQIKEIVHDVIERLSNQNPDKNQQIQRVWQEAVGKKVFKHTQIAGLKDGRLLIRVDSPVMMFHLNLKRSQILKALQKIDQGLSTIELRVGRVQ
ncbi:MAG: DUF721 domain-containing protein [Candidatus Omnitrophica bacterium]|nr:DUF721 domain-containing protein [Candidatus Omnitrophota bacterium]